jgi:hypothetical protein
MNIRRLDTTNPADVRTFINLAYPIYRDYPLWVPPINSDINLMLDRGKHPYYQHSDAEFFLAERNRKPLGRIAVLHHHNYCAYHHRNTAFFYLFECLNDQEIAQALVNTIAEWASSHGLDHIYGSKGFLRSNGQGILVEGFDHSPSMGIPYNPPYYQTLLEGCGLTKETDFFSGSMVRSQSISPKLYQVADRVKERGSFWIKTFRSSREIFEWIPKVEQVHAVSFAANPNYVPSTAEEFGLMARTMIQIVEPDMVKLIMKGDEVAGFVITYPNICTALRRCHGHLFPFGWLDILIEKKRTRIADANGIGILPQYQGLGANALVYVELDKTLRAKPHLQQLDYVQVDERNFKSKSDMDTLGVNWNVIHRFYGMDL